MIEVLRAVAALAALALATSPQAPANFAGEWSAISFKGDQQAAVTLPLFPPRPIKQDA